MRKGLDAVMGYLSEWTNLLLRWFHVTAAIAWIGESFYFVMLDRSLANASAKDAASGMAGEFWSVHGGGLYQARKFIAAPGGMPHSLHWSRWKSYATWLSGAALLALFYLASPELYLIDPSVLPLTRGLADTLALLYIFSGWIVYDLLCKSLAGHDRALLAAIAGLVVFAAYAATHIFSGRVAFLLTGAMLATIMSANVLFVIIPGQKSMVQALARKKEAAAALGLRGRQRSAHNTYFTLPVVFAMTSNHYAFLTQGRNAWLVLAGLMLSGALVRQFFVLWHEGRRAVFYPALAAAVTLALMIWLAPAATPASNVSFADARRIVEQRCAPCHAAHPAMMPSAPKGIMLDTDARIKAAASLIWQQAVQAHAMPLGNATGITEAERAALGAWIAQGAGG